jgi:hypothetical protein
VIDKQKPGECGTMQKCDDLMAWYPTVMSENGWRKKMYQQVKAKRSGVTCMPCLRRFDHSLWLIDADTGTLFTCEARIE